MFLEVSVDELILRILPLKHSNWLLTGSLGENTKKISPVVSRLSRGVYGLVGADVPPGIVEELQPDYGQKKRRLIDWGWTEKGEPWFVVELSQSMTSVGVLGVPAGLKNMLQGDWQLRGFAGDEIFHFSVRDTRLSKLNPALRRLGAENGDMAAVVFNLANRHAQAFLGGEEMVEKLQSDASRQPAGADAAVDILLNEFEE